MPGVCRLTLAASACCSMLSESAEAREVVGLPSCLDASSWASRLLPACRPCSRKRANPLAGANQVGIGHQFLCTPCCAVPCCAAQLCCVAYHGAPPYAALL